jgi:mRNA guanylyltransferase
LKWKPPSENSIDFKLVLRFPPLKDDPEQVDFCAKPLFLLEVYCGEDRGKPKYEEYDKMFVEDDEWEKYTPLYFGVATMLTEPIRMKLSGKQIDDRIVEVHWDADNSRWRMMRFRDDKPAGNHKSVVENIISSIADGVEKEGVRFLHYIFGALLNIYLYFFKKQLLARSNAIRHAWKLRQSQAPPYPQEVPGRQAGPPPQAPHPQPSNQVNQSPPPPIQFNYGPLAPSPWSKVSGPSVIAGVKR